MRNRWLVALALALVGVAPPASAEEPADGAVTEILGILKERGLVDETEYTRLVSKNQAYEERQKSLIPKLSFYGDVRQRYEGFWYDDVAGTSAPADQQRGRLRARLGVNAQINPSVLAGMRIASGQNDSRSENETYGVPAEFGPGGIFLDLAYLTLKVPNESMPLERGTASITAGKMMNPVRWSSTPDQMLWDPDITPSGVSASFGSQPYENFRWFANGSMFVIEENSGSKDPHLVSAQVGVEFTPLSSLAIGSRATWYGFYSVDRSFLRCGINSSTGSNCATKAAGNLVGGLSGDPNGGTIDVGETSIYATWKGFSDWPITVFGDVSQNFSAEKTLGASAQGLAYMGGLELGDKTKWVRLGASWMAVQANAFPSQFIDSDYLDGVTNHEGWSVYGIRQIVKNLDFKLELFGDQPIETSDAYANSIVGSKRLRLRADMDVKF